MLVGHSESHENCCTLHFNPPSIRPGTCPLPGSRYGANGVFSLAMIPMWECRTYSAEAIACRLFSVQTASESPCHSLRNVAAGQHPCKNHSSAPSSPSVAPTHPDLRGALLADLSSAKPLQKLENACLTYKPILHTGSLYPQAEGLTHHFMHSLTPAARIRAQANFTWSFVLILTW